MEETDRRKIHPHRLGGKLACLRGRSELRQSVLLWHRAARCQTQMDGSPLNPDGNLDSTTRLAPPSTGSHLLEERVLPFTSNLCHNPSGSVASKYWTPITADDRSNRWEHRACAGWRVRYSLTGGDGWTQPCGERAGCLPTRKITLSGERVLRVRLQTTYSISPTRPTICLSN